MLGILPLGAIEQAGGARQIARRRFLPSGADAAAQQEEGGKVLLGDAERHTGDREAFAAGAVENLRAPWHGDAAPLLEQRLEQRHLALAPRAKDRKSVVSGKSVSVRVGLGGCRIIKKKTSKQNQHKKQ